VKRTRTLAGALVGLWLLGASIVPASAATPQGAASLGDDSLCTSHRSLCVDPYDTLNNEYVGHDEPSVLFKSSVPGSGNDMTYQVTLPKDPPQKPKNDGSGGTWNFQLRPTFWFGMTLCDTESAPEYTKTCAPDSDANALEGLDPNQPDYIGHHPGNAYMELQFYGPGYVPQFEGFGCSAKQYCAAMTIDSLTENQATGAGNNSDCSNYILGGIEPINWAYVTKSGNSQAPANPLFTGTFSAPNLSAVTPDYNKDLMMSPGDRITIHMHDTTAGFRVDITDNTTHQSGSMTASIANGFGHILYEPDSTTCHMDPYAFHPEYSTGNPRGNTWSAHTYNIAYSDEIGHFENCLTLDAAFNCVAPTENGGTPDEDDGNSFCVPGTDSLKIKINGCFFDDEDFDGQSYRNDWPGTNPNAKQDAKSHPTPVLFTSPLIKGTTNYSNVLFEADLPRIEASDSQFNPPFCNRTTGENCVNPPAGAVFYPFYTTRMDNGTCTWQEGGNYIPGTIDHFGGNSTSAYGPLLLTPYQVPITTSNPTGIVHRYNNFQNDLGNNPCPVTKGPG
jgi:hypothetical protein